MTHYLYSFRRCPYAMRARMTLFYAEIAIKIHDIQLKDKPQKMIALSPKGTVPVLLCKDGGVIDESLDIMIWALQQNDPAGWLSYPPHAYDLIKENDGDFKKALDRYKYPVRYPDEDCSYAKNHCFLFLEKLDHILEDHHFLYSPHITMIDIAIFPFIRQCANTDRAWFDNLLLPHLQKWLDGHLDSVLFKKIMEKPQKEITSYFMKEGHQKE